MFGAKPTEPSAVDALDGEPLAAPHRALAALRRGVGSSILIGPATVLIGAGAGSIPARPAVPFT